MNVLFEKPVEDHDAALYQAAAQAIPIQGFSAVDDAAVERYREDGYLVISRAFDAETISTALAELKSMALADDPECSSVAYEGSLRSVIAQTQGSDVSSLSDDEITETIKAMPSEARAGYVRKFMGFTKTHPLLGAISSDPALRSTVARLIGEKPKLFQSMALVKPPKGREKPWHQDHAYFNLPIETRIAGVWIALEHVTPENGCMFVLPGEHTLGPRLHFKRRDWQMCDTDIYGHREVSLPMGPGDLVIFDAKLPHGTPTNRTNVQRWALQFHYVPASAQSVAEEERLAVFGSEGKGVEC